MWFIFPQIVGLGQSPISIRFAIAALDEAKAYLAHPGVRRRRLLHKKRTTGSRARQRSRRLHTRI
jgi:uncharacterized protein (DUF1810 family)